MVLRPSSSSWSVSPETIMSHHYKLAQGVKSVVDTSPPFSMYNSPISIHYVPKRASSADSTKRRQAKLPRPHRELAEFIGIPYGAAPPSLRLPLPLNGIDVKPKILQSRNYQPPLHRNRQKPSPSPPQINPWTDGKRRSGKNQRNPKDNFCFDLFKDAVYSTVIDREVFTDGVIAEVVETEMEKWCHQISWDDLEYLREEIFEELGMGVSRFAPRASKIEKRSPKKKQKSITSPTSTGSRSDTLTSSGSSISEIKSNSGSKSEPESSAASESEEEESDATSQFSEINSESSSK